MRHPKRIEPGPGQESVWDYPRPPAVQPVTDRVVVRLGGTVVADTTDAVRVLETSHPPVYYLPVADMAEGSLVRAEGSSMCEFKGRARYFDVVGGDGTVASRAAWDYPTPEPGYESLRDHVAIYPSAMDSCEVGGEVVQAQEGDFYGGWITADIVGPFKGGAGTFGW
ncbi:MULTISPECIES: DUF427 domain-containing protein [Curtobacterium]|uniref:DUF427 domain-containing protein n=1 Tax=Curtobacterium TaxID=2034 RepID=UPI0018E5284E|nr:MULTISPECIES: DUF427 domain-containing protein [Curtobacterium]MCA5923939.1 DUF427 domain-containing protein [Curtobacterium oceanosedimentum]QQD77266.1 DUF427 domain-containing protein [Curtobacterium sp. YC1]